MRPRPKNVGMDWFWHSPEAVTPLELRELSTAVKQVRGRKLQRRTLFTDGSPEALVIEAAFQPGDRLYVAGGDGSLHAAVGALMDSGVPAENRPEIALLPRGTGNDFARSLGLPLDEWEAIVRTAVGGRAVPGDLGRINNGVFVNAVTMGFGAEATRDIWGGFKQVAGGAGYAAVTAWKAITAEPFTVTLKCGETHWTGELLALIVLNGRSIGGGAEIGVQSRIDDGMIDVAVFPPFGATELTDLIADLRADNPAVYRHLRYFQGPSIEISCDRPLALSVDGEPSEGAEFSFSVDPGALRFVRGESGAT